MESRVFFPIVNPQTSFNLASSSVVTSICKNAPSLFGNEVETASNKIVSSFSPAVALGGNKESSEKRSDLYLVLPPSSAGCFIGIKWRGQTDSLLASSSLKGSQQDREIFAVQQLLWASVEVKISPSPLLAGKEQEWLSSSATTDETFPKSEPSQMWYKYRLKSFGGDVKTALTKSGANNPISLKSIFISSVSKALLKLSEEVQQEMKPALKIAATKLATTDPRFAIVGVAKSRRKGLFSSNRTSWNIEQTDMAVEDVTSKFFPNAEIETIQASVGEKILVRSWCIEPNTFFGLSEKDTAKYAQLGDEFVKSCALLDETVRKKNNVDGMIIASYPHFLSEKMFSSSLLAKTK